MVFALLEPHGLRELVVAGGDVVDDDVPLAVGVEGSQRPGVLDVGGAEVGVLLRDRRQAVHAQVGVEKNVLKIRFT